MYFIFYTYFTLYILRFIYVVNSSYFYNLRFIIFIYIKKRNGKIIKMLYIFDGSHNYTRTMQFDSYKNFYSKTYKKYIYTMYNKKYINFMIYIYIYIYIYKLLIV